MSRDAVDALIDGRRVKLDARPEACAHGGGLARPHRPRDSRDGTHGIFRRTAAQAGAETPGDAAGAGNGHPFKNAMSASSPKRRSPRLVQTLKGIDLPDHGLCAVRIRHRDGRRRAVRRGESLYDGVAESSGGSISRARCSTSMPTRVVTTSRSPFSTGRLAGMLKK